MWSAASKSGCTKYVVKYFFSSVSTSVSHLAINAGKLVGLSRSYAGNFVLEEVEEGIDSDGRTLRKSYPPMSLAKSLACLPDEDEPSSSEKRKRLSRMEMKRLIELRIKKRVKAQYLNGKFHDLMDKVIANADTLQDAYDIIRLNSNVDLASKKDDVCFVSLAEQLRSGEFDVSSNSRAMFARGGRKECLVLPKLQLKIIQEAIRTTLEVVYRPHFSKISHGCRSGRGHHSALRYIMKEVHKPDWWFTICVDKEVDSNVLSKLFSVMSEKIEDGLLFAFIHCMFDARVLNLYFGGFAKSHGLPQEGILSPILMNIYLDMFDREFFRICMKYEGLSLDPSAAKEGHFSKLRSWVRRQMKDSVDGNGQSKDGTMVRINACRYMDEIFISVSGSNNVAFGIKDELISYLKNSLYLDVEDTISILEVNNNSWGIQFLGTVVRVAAIESDAVRAVHKLKDKVQLFASQKKEIWNAGTARIGKKWLAYSLKRIKESEIKQLGLSTPMLDYISKFRKDGMKTDHWFKSLLKIWLQDVNARKEASEEVVLSKYIAEPALPQDLRDSFYNFQKKAEEYVLLETNATLALLSSSTDNAESTTSPEKTAVTVVEAPISFIMKSLHRYGMISLEGYPRPVSTLVFQEDTLIVSWFSGIVRRWLKWYSKYNNFGDVKVMIVECVRKSCIRTLAAKHQMHETLVEKRFESELCEIPGTEELDTAVPLEGSEPSFPDDDEALMYGISHSGQCLLSLSRVKVPTRVFNCFVMGCSVASPSMYAIDVKERQRFPGWKTGFSTTIHPSLNGRRIGLCNQHVKDLYLGHISLQSVEFGALSN